MDNKTDNYEDVTVGDMLNSVITTFEGIIVTIVTLGLALLLSPPNWLDRLANTMFWCFIIGLSITSADYILSNPAILTYQSRFEFVLVTMGLGTGIYLTSFIFYKTCVKISRIVVYRKKIQDERGINK